MKVTNRLGLHPAIVAAVEHQDAAWYSGTGEKRWASVTELIAPVTLTALKRAHVDELEEEASDCLWRLRGAALHRTVEELLKADSRAECEPRFSMEVLGKLITGGADIIWTGTEIVDLKDTSVWHLVHAKNMLPQEYVEQLNLYRLMAGGPIDKLSVIVMLRDWSKSKVSDVNYPAAQCLTLDVPVWPREKAEAFIQLRVSMLKTALAMKPENLPACTPEERWEKPTTYVVKKKGQKACVRGSAKLQTHAQAEAFIAKMKSKAGLSVEQRLGARTRCEGYCPVSRWCKDYQAFLGDPVKAYQPSDSTLAPSEEPPKKDLWGATVPPRKRRTVKNG